MKKIFSFLLFGVLSLFIYASGITIGGKTYAVDTIVHSHDIGPGTKYAFYDIPAYLSFNWLKGLDNSKGSFSRTSRPAA